MNLRNAVAVVSIALPYILDLVTGPVGQVVSIQDMQAFGYVVEPDQFGVLDDAIQAASNVIEGDTGRKLLTQTWDVSWHRFPGSYGQLVLPWLPVSSVTSVKYYDTAGTQQTLSSSLYTVNDGSKSAQGYIVPAYNEIWPSTYGHDRDVTVRFVCGYGAASAVPKEIKWQIMSLAMGLFRERQPDGCGSGGKSMVYDVLANHNRSRTMEFI